MALEKKWTEADIEIRRESNDAFERWCKSEGIRYKRTVNWAPAGYWPPVNPTAKRDEYHIWCKWPHKILMAKMTWSGF